MRGTEATTAKGGRPGHRASRSRSRRIVLALFTVASFVVAATVGFLGGGFLRYTEEVSALTERAIPAKSDGIVVLTGGALRIDRAIDLLVEGHGRRLLITGVNPGTSAATLAQLTGVKRALFECCIDLDYAALDTVGNAENAIRWARKNGFQRLILVTSDYHMPRSLREFDRIDSLLHFIPYSVRRSDLWASGDMPTLSGLKILLTEYAKLVGARLAGAVGISIAAGPDRSEAEEMAGYTG